MAEKNSTEQKTPAHLAGLGPISATSVEEIASVEHSGVSFADCKRRRYDQHDDGYVLVQSRTGVG